MIPPEILSGLDPLEGVPLPDEYGPGEPESGEGLTPDDELYWADRKGVELIKALDDKELAFFEACDRQGFTSMWRAQYAQYYGKDLGTMGGVQGAHSVQAAGEDGESIIFRLNEARSIISMQIQTTIGERASFQCMATNDDYESVSQVEPCDELVSYVYRETHAEQKERQVYESDSNFGYAFGWVRWDGDGGEEMTWQEELPVNTNDPSMGAVMADRSGKSGAPTVDVVYPWECVQEPRAKTHLWRRIRERRSKYELAASWPEFAEKLRQMDESDEYVVERLFGLDHDDSDCDDVIVKHFYHERCAAIPNGRYVVTVGDITLIDDSCPTMKGLPLVEMCSEKYIGTSFGYASAWMLNPPQQMLDQLLSDTASNLAIFGRQVIAATEGTDFDVDALANGTRLMTIPHGTDPPQAMNFASMPEPVKWVLEFLLRRMEALSGVNGVVRGDPQTNISSGSMAALFHEISVKYMGFRQVARDFYREQMANLLLDFMRANGKGGFVAQIVGDSDRPYLKQFSMEQIAGVRKVIVKTRNPMLENPHGRLELMMATASIENPDDRRAAINLILTGDTSAFTESDQTETNAIKWENKVLAEGLAVPVLQFDSHKTHYREHKAAFNKRREEYVLDYLQEMAGAPPTPIGIARKTCLDHLQGHVMAALQQHPLMTLWNEESLPNVAPKGAMGGGGQAAGGSGMMTSGSDPAANAGVDQPDTAQPAQAPGGPAVDQGEAA